MEVSERSHEGIEDGPTVKMQSKDDIMRLRSIAQVCRLAEQCLRIIAKLPLESAVKA